MKSIIELAREAGFRSGNINLSSGDPLPFAAPISATDCLPELRRFAHLVRNAALEEAAKVIERHRIPVGNSAAGEMACEMTYDALKHIRHEIRAMKEQT